MYRQNQTAARDAHNVKPPKAPERPLTPYMRFSRKMWPKIRQENPDHAIWDISKTIKQLWNVASESEKSVYQHEFNIERLEYEKIMKAYQNSTAYQQYLVARTRVKPNEKPVGGGGGGSRNKGTSTGSDLNNIVGIVVQPVDEEDPFEMTAKRLAAIRYDRNNRLMAELFAPNYLPDSRTIVPQQRVEQLEKQRLALAKHQQKLNDDLAEIEEAFNHRKRTIDESSAAFETELKRLRDERPEPSEERYGVLIEECKDVLLKGYEEYQKRQAAIRARLEAERREVPVLYSLTCGKSPSPEAPKEEPSDPPTQANGVVTAPADSVASPETDGGDSVVPAVESNETPLQNGTLAADTTEASTTDTAVTTAQAESATTGVEAKNNETPET